MRSAVSVRGGIGVVAVATLTVLVGCGSPSERLETGQAPDAPRPVPPDEITPLAGSVLAPPRPVTGADGNEHVAYELLLHNPFSLLVTVGKLETLDENGDVLATLEGDAIPALLDVFATGPAATFGGGQSATLVLDVVADRPSAVPDHLVHRVTVSLEESPGVPFDNSAGTLATTFETAPTDVLDEEPVVIAPPLRGEDWWDAVGCCATRTSHRGAILAINGAFHVAERYAIDFVQFDEQGRLFVGPPDELSSYAYFGTPIHAVADGPVVNLLDGLPEQVPGALPAGITGATAGGNFIVQDIGDGNFAFYAHMQPGSLRFELGGMIRQGEVIGLLGNTGNTDAPHLHFHVMDGPGPLSSNGVPYEFTRFEGEGVVTNLEEVIAGGRVNLDTSTLVGPTRSALPLDQQVVSFGR